MSDQKSNLQVVIEIIVGAIIGIVAGFAFGHVMDNAAQHDKEQRKAEIERVVDEKLNK